MEASAPMPSRLSTPLTIKLQLTLVFGALVVLAAVVLTWVLGDMLREKRAKRALMCSSSPSSRTSSSPR